MQLESELSVQVGWKQGHDFKMALMLGWGQTMKTKTLPKCVLFPCHSQSNCPQLSEKGAVFNNTVCDKI